MASDLLFHINHAVREVRDGSETSLHSVMGDEYYEFSLLLQCDFRKTIMKPGNACPKAHVGEVEYPPPIPIDITPEKVATSADTVLSGLDKEDDNNDTSSDDNEMPWTSTTGPTNPSLFEDSVKKRWMATGQSSSDNKVEKPNGTNTQPHPQRLRIPPGLSRPPSGPSGPPSAPSGLPPVLSKPPPVPSAPISVPSRLPPGLFAPTPALSKSPLGLLAPAFGPTPALGLPRPSSGPLGPLPGLPLLRSLHGLPTPPPRTPRNIVAQPESTRNGSTAATVHFYHYDMPTASGNVLVTSTSALAGYPKIMNMVVRAKALQDQFFGHSGSANSEILVNISFLNWRSFKVAMEYAHNRMLKVGANDNAPGDDELAELLGVSKVATRLDMDDLIKECAAFMPGRHETFYMYSYVHIMINGMILARAQIGVKEEVASSGPKLSTFLTEATLYDAPRFLRATVGCGVSFTLVCRLAQVQDHPRSRVPGTLLLSMQVDASASSVSFSSPGDNALTMQSSRSPPTKWTLSLQKTPALVNFFHYNGLMDSSKAVAASSVNLEKGPQIMEMI
ncbi:hypothetical protein BG005_007707 [Podila minutissima]|nr:hypothetical protein BG005_007707 [Podila minutissima]